jgi:type IV pilus assembly protein PilE
VPQADRFHRDTPPARQRGFTLIELMIVVVVIGILASIAYPSFTQQIIKANRSAAQSFMLNIASRQERYLLDARGYTDTLGAGGLNLTIPPEVADSYTIELVADNAATPPVYTIVALPVPGTRQTPDGMLSLDSFGTRIPSEKWQ